LRTLCVRDKSLYSIRSLIFSQWGYLRYRPVAYSGVKELEALTTARARVLDLLKSA